MHRLYISPVFPVISFIAKKEGRKGSGRREGRKKGKDETRERKKGREEGRNCRFLKN